MLYTCQSPGLTAWGDAKMWLVRPVLQSYQKLQKNRWKNFQTNYYSSELVIDLHYAWDDQVRIIILISPKRNPCRKSVELDLVSLQVEQSLVEDLVHHQQQLVLPGRLPVAHDHGLLPHHEHSDILLYITDILRRIFSPGLAWSQVPTCQCQ